MKRRKRRFSSRFFSPMRRICTRSVIMGPKYVSGGALDDREGDVVGLGCAGSKGGQRFVHSVDNGGRRLVTMLFENLDEAILAILVESGIVGFGDAVAV